jgi:UDP-N-acetylglucosamine transferase subunit ALG13
MILVVLGTWEMPFTRPLIEIEHAVKDGVFAEPIVVQCGNTNYPSPYMTMTPFFGQHELERMYEQATFIICQAGVGSIMLGLKKQKKVVSIARLAEHDEHIDDHQLEILGVFSKLGAVLPWHGNGDLTDVLRQVVTFVPAPYPFGEERVSRAILTYLDEHIRVP